MYILSYTICNISKISHSIYTTSSEGLFGPDGLQITTCPLSPKKITKIKPTTDKSNDSGRSTAEPKIQTFWSVKPKY